MLYRQTRWQRLAFQALWMAEHASETLLRHSGVFRRARSRVHAGLVQEALSASPAREAVPRVDGLEPDSFQHAYVRQGRPVVFEGAASNWPAVKCWTPQWCAENLGDERVRVLDLGPGESPVPGTGRDLRFEQVVADMDSESRPYARFSGVLHRRPELVADLDVAWLRSMRQRQGFENWGFFLGGAGTATGLHASIAPNLFVQIFGTKRWTIYPARAAGFFLPPVKRSPYFYSDIDVQDAARWPAADRVPGWEVVLSPGDVLYVPSFAWHQVSNLSANVAVGYRWMDVPSGLRASVTQTLLAASATNPFAPLRAKGNPELPDLLDGHAF